MKKRLTVLALAFAMVLTMSASVFAAGQNASSADSSAQGKDAAANEAKLVKYLQMPEGINDPGETFTFTFKPTKSTNETYGVPVVKNANSPDYWAPVTTTIASSSMTAVSTGDAADTGNKVGTKTIADIFNGYDFPRAGEYCFKVAETAGSTEGMTYASDTYTLRLIVDNEGTIDDVTVQNKDGEKVDPTDDTPENNEPAPTPADSNGGFTFTNSYTKDVTTHDEPGDKNPDPDPTDPTHPGDIDEGPDTPENPDIVKEDQPGAYVLDKYVLGEYGDQNKDFEFAVTVTLPKLRKNFDFTANAPTVTKGSISGTWEDGEAVTVKLEHEGQLKFPKLPIGTKIEVSEAAVDGYTQVLTTSEADDAAKVTVTEDAGGYAIMRNSFHDENVTPTGIIINNLPYVLLIGLALGGIVLFSRKRRYE